MPKVICIGMPVFNGADYVRQALEALLAQTWRDFRIIALDDGSSDGSYKILESIAKLDQRISIFRNPERTGLIAAWNRVAILAGEVYDAEYFGWYSDHDWVNEVWLEQLYRTLENNPETVLAHSRTTFVDPEQLDFTDEGYSLDTVGEAPLDALRKVTLGFFGAGDAIYGLFRFKALEKIGFLPFELFPDRLVVSQMCLFGEIRNVRQAERFRRNLSPEDYSDVIVKRQLSTLFPSTGQAPGAPLISHSTYLLRKYLEDSSPGADIKSRLLSLIHALFYLQRSSLKFQEQWEQEIQQLHGIEHLRVYKELIMLLYNGQWTPLAHEDQLRLIYFRGLSKELYEKIGEMKTQLSQKKIRVQQVKKALLEKTAQSEKAEKEIIEVYRHPIRFLLKYYSKRFLRLIQ